MTVAEDNKPEPKPESRPFEADVAKLLQLMVHSVYSDKSVFLRELIANAADACERLRYEAIAEPALLGDDVKPRITLALDAEKRAACRRRQRHRHEPRRDGRGARHHRAVGHQGVPRAHRGSAERRSARIERAHRPVRRRLLFGLHGGRSGRGCLAPRRQRCAWLWSSDGKGTFAVAPAAAADAPPRGTRVILHLLEDAKTYAERFTIEQLVKAQSGHVPVPIAIVEKPGAEPAEITDGAALWTKPKSEITAADYTDFYRSIAGQFDEPALTIHFRAEGRQDYTTLLFVPGSRPFDLFDPDRNGRIKLYVKRVFITDDAEILPRYLRFVRGLVDSADLPLNVSREKIQESPLLAAIRKGATSRVLSELERLADKEPQAYAKIWDTFGAVLKEGIYEDFERRDALLATGAVQDHGCGRRMAQPQGLRRRAQDQSDRDLLSRRRRYRAA